MTIPSFGKIPCMDSTKLMVLALLCVQNSFFTLLRRYSQGVLKETYSKHELLLVAEIIKVIFSAWVITSDRPEDDTTIKWSKHLLGLVSSSGKMVTLALMYGAMNILSFIALRNISAGMFTIIAQCKILTTAVCSTIMLKQEYSWTKWRALCSLMLGVIIFSQPVWGNHEESKTQGDDLVVLGTMAVVIEVTLSGFASVYFEKVIKTDPSHLNIWERNFQLSLTSIPIYSTFILLENGGQSVFFAGWSWIASLLACLGAAGGLLVALSIKYGDSILKTLAVTGAIILSSVLDHLMLGGPLTPSMIIAGCQVIISIINYTFDMSPTSNSSKLSSSQQELYR